MNYNHITSEHRKFISPKEAEASPTGIDGNFIHLSVGIAMLLSYRSRYKSSARYGLPFSEEDSAW